MKKILLALFIIPLIFISCEKTGCTDCLASNYDSEVTSEDNTTCIYSECITCHWTSGITLDMEFCQSDFPTLEDFLAQLEFAESGGYDCCYY